jgi:alginate O-acetyltransferase complex protein AlgI
MLFNSASFLFVFLPIVLAIYWLTPRGTPRKYVLVLSSYVFYGLWSPKFAALMLATTSVDYFTARRIDASSTARGRKAWLVLSLVSNLGVLAVFKYYDFFASSANALTGTAALPLLRVVLPIGISFYTFESMSYTVDVYRREVAPLTRFIDYVHFVTMFPRLVAGPIVRYKDLARQLSAAPRRLDLNAVPEALHMLAVGMAKKVLIADILAAKIVDGAFLAPKGLGLVEAWSAALGYTAQLYFDFSGYSDMAVGLGLLFGLRLPRNFALPYASENPSEFWRRWHISLSTWLRDYLYIPLGGNRGSRARTQVNLFLTMLLGGLWHGANWTFVLWGAYHGIALALYNSGIARARWMPRVGAIACTFLVTVIGWVLFRATSLSGAVEVYRAMLGANGLGIAFARAHAPLLSLLSIALTISFTIDTPELWTKIRARLAVRWALVDALLLAACLTRLTLPSPFLYFQF